MRKRERETISAIDLAFDSGEQSSDRTSYDSKTGIKGLVDTGIIEIPKISMEYSSDWTTSLKKAPNQIADQRILASRSSTSAETLS